MEPSAKKMSNKKCRTDKQCLNCGHEVQERYCSHCGQENLEYRNSAWVLVVDFVKDSFNYDSRLWHTLGQLVLRPGQIALEYMNGKRRQNLEPIRFYIFASSIFFLLLYFRVGSFSNETTPGQKISDQRRIFHLHQEKEMRKGTPDTVCINQLIHSIQSPDDSSNTGGNTNEGDLEIDLFAPQLDSVQSEGWLGKLLLERIEQRQREMQQQHDGDEASASSAFLDEIFHSLPQLFFLSLPFFAFFLKLLYWRRPGTLYVEHFIFSIYYYAYMYVVLTTVILINALVSEVDAEALQEPSSWVTTLLAIYPFAYLLLAMKRFYHDRWLKLLFRYLTLLILFCFNILFLFIVVAFVTFIW